MALSYSTMNRLGVAKVFDCFPFFNELDLLEIRLHELSDVVDRFVLAESPTTFSGEPKPLHFAENRARFAPFLDRIHHIVVDETPSGGEAGWKRQDRQRNALAGGIADAAPDDLILLSDVDEIPNAEAVRRATARPADRREVVCFELRMFNYFVNLEAGHRWLRNGPRAIRRRYLGAFKDLRAVRGPVGNPLRDFFRGLRASTGMGQPIRRVVLRDAGWHFTYLGGAAAVQEKLKSFIGSERIDPDDLDLALLTARIEAGRPMNRRVTTTLTLRPLDAGFPDHLRRHQDRFSHLIAAEPAL